MKYFNRKKVLFFLVLIGVIAISANKFYSNNIKESYRSGMTIVDIRTGKAILSTSSNRKDNIIKMQGLSRGGLTKVDIETGEVISSSKYNY